VSGGSRVSRAGEKLDRALAAFGLDVAGLACADFGCNVGGFVEVLLERGAARVIAIDTGYGTLAWKLRTDPRVETRERTNALHAEPPPEGVDLVSVDLAWTPQRLAVPAALRWLRSGGRIVTLVKPHYELREGERGLLERGFLPHAEAERVLARVAAEMPALGAEVLAACESPLVGGKSSRRAGVPGNREWLLLLGPRATPADGAAIGPS